MKLSIRVLYLYLFSFVGLLITVIGLIRVVDLGMKTYIFPGVDVYEEVAVPRMEGEEMMIDEGEMRAMREREAVRSRQRELSSSLAMIVVGVPLYAYHWKTIKKEKA